MHKKIRNSAMRVATGLLAASMGQAESLDSVRIRAAIPSQPLENALQEWAQQSGFQLLYDSSLSTNQRSRETPAGLRPIDALARVLDGTGLVYQYINERTVSILPSSHDAHVSGQNIMFESLGLGAGLVDSQLSDSGTEDQSATRDDRSSARHSKSSPSRDITEVVVTAQKRSERLQDVPVPVTSINAESLVSSNQLRLQDYSTRIAGFSVVPGIQSSTFLTIRGITTVGQNPTVGVTVDDMPYGASTGGGGGGAVPDIDPSELARVEVLRGPQGTLYGASSMGGLLKYVTVDPSTEKLSGQVQAGLSSVYKGDDLGYNVRGSVNIPISDSIAMRASGFRRRDPGYIDDPALHIDDINRVDVSGGRLSALWKASDLFSLKLSALFQDTEGAGSSDVGFSGVYGTPTLGDLQQNYLLGTGWYDREIQAYSAVVTADFGRVNLTSVSGYNVNTFSDSLDASFFFGDLTRAIYGVGGAPIVDDYRTSKFTQEIRLQLPIGARVDWLVGAFYTDEDSKNAQEVVAVDPATGLEVGSLFVNAFRPTFEEYAAFTNVTFQITDRLDVQLGGRQSETRQVVESSVRQASTASVFTYLLTPRFKVSTDLMLYARLASGYRPGGGGATGPTDFCVVFQFPCEYKPDKTQNYEVGLKGEFLDRRLSVDASLFYIDWKDIQVVAFDPNSRTNFSTNGSGARSQGLELAIESRPLNGLTLAATIAAIDAELTEDFPPGPVEADAGDRLPLSSRFSGSFSLDQDFLLTTGLTGFLGGSVSYVGERAAGIGTDGPDNYPAYAKTDFRAGVRSDTWAVNVFVNNATDKRALLYRAFAFSTYIQPRTVGLSLVRMF
jgi:iron complex outermembrane recepter protein